MNKRTLTIALAGLLAAVLAFLLLRGMAVFASPELQFVTTPTRRLTGTPSRRAPTPAVKQLQNQLAFGGLGAGGDMFYCEAEMLGQLDSYPGISLSERWRPNLWDGDYPLEFATFCIFGLPFEGGLSFELYRPDEELASYAEYELGGENTEIDGWDLLQTDPEATREKAMATYLEGVPVIAVNAWLPAGLPEGEWWAAAYTPEGSAEASLSLPPLKSLPLVQVGQPPAISFPEADPLGEVLSSYILGQANLERTFRSGERLTLYGMGFTPGSLTPIGIYRDKDEGNNSELVAQARALADRNGAWKISYVIAPGDSPGNYDILAALVPEDEYAALAGPYARYQVAEWRPCPNTYLSRLKIGMIGIVDEEFTGTQPLWTEPTQDAEVSGGMEPGEEFEIQDGPHCAEGWIWWYVRSPSGLEGWTAEGSKNERWLLPGE